MNKKPPKYLVFSTMDEQYAISIKSIVTIEKMEYECKDYCFDKRIKKVKAYPAFIEGLFPFKKYAIPVVNLEKLFGHDDIKRHDENKIIIVRGNEQIFGILVDDVDIIVELDESKFTKLYEDKPIYSTEHKSEIFTILNIHELTQNNGLEQTLQHIEKNLK
jgi:purine-binding chemotaxis protein CheW